MERAAETADWDTFFAGQTRDAVDLGCGSGIETRALVDAGWAVTAVDASETVLRLLADSVVTDRLRVVQARLEEYDVSPADLVHASFSLPYCPPEHFAAMWQRIRDSLHPGGIVVGNLFGIRDTCATVFEDPSTGTSSRSSPGGQRPMVSDH